MTVESSPGNDRASENTSEMLRAFFAIELDDATRGAAAKSARALRERSGEGAVRWVAEESYHVTLRFIGDLERERIPMLTDCVREQTAGLRPFRLELGGAHPFPSRRRPRFLVLDVGPAEPLEELAGAVGRGVERAGFGSDSKPFRPHLTLGRLRSKKFAAVTGDVTPVGESCMVNDAVLFQSDLHPSGARYTPLERVPFARARE